MNYEIVLTSTSISPPGVEIFTLSPTVLPNKPLAIGESFEISPSNGSASAEPTIVYVSSSPSGSSINVTVFQVLQYHYCLLLQ